MSIRITIYDGATPMLDRIALLSHHSALAALDQAGMELRDRTREEFAKSQGHNWHTKIVNGKRVFYRGFPAILGKRLNFRKAGPPNMSNMIDSYLMDRSMTVVVAGMHKNFKPRFYSKEAAQGITTPIYGNQVGQVLHGSYQILKKLSQGGRYSNLDSDYKRLTRGGNSPKPLGADPFYKPRHFIERGRNAAMGRVQDIMTTKLEALIGRQVNRATVKNKVRAS